MSTCVSVCARAPSALVHRRGIQKSDYSLVVDCRAGILVDLLINTIFDPPLGDLSFLLAIFGCAAVYTSRVAPQAGLRLDWTICGVKAHQLAHHTACCVLRRAQLLLLIGLALMVFLLLTKIRLFRAGQVGWFAPSLPWQLQLGRGYVRGADLTGVVVFGERRSLSYCASSERFWLSPRSTSYSFLAHASTEWCATIQPARSAGFPLCAKPVPA